MCLVIKKTNSNNILINCVVNFWDIKICLHCFLEIPENAEFEEITAILSNSPDIAIHIRFSVLLRVPENVPNFTEITILYNALFIKFLETSRIYRKLRFSYVLFKNYQESPASPGNYDSYTLFYNMH